MNRNVKYRSIAYGTWNVGDARKFVEEKFNGTNNKKIEDKHSNISSLKNESIAGKVNKNFLTLKISSDSGVLFRDELRSVTPFMETPVSMKFSPSFNYYNQEDNLLTLSTTETDSLKFDSLEKVKKTSINNQHSMADSGIVDNSDSSAEGDWYSSTEYIQYCQKMQQTANTENDFSFSSTITNTKKDDNNHHCSLETIYQNSVSPNSNVTITNKNISPTIIFNNTHLKPLKSNSSYTIKNPPPLQLKATMTAPCQIIPLNNDYIYYKYQPNSLSHYETTFFHDSPINNVHYNNCHRPYFQTNIHRMTNILSHQNNQHTINYNTFSVLNDSLNCSQNNSIILDDNSKYHHQPNLLSSGENYHLKCYTNGIDKRRAKSVEISNSHSVILNDQGYNTMRIKNYNAPLNVMMKKELNSNNLKNKHESLNNYKNRISITDNSDNKKDKTFSAIKSTKNFFQRIFTNPTSTLPKKWKKENDKNNSASEEAILDDWSHMNALTTLKKYGTIHRTKTDTNCILNSEKYYDFLRKQYQSDININDHAYPFSIDAIYKDFKDLSIVQPPSQKSSSDSCYTSTISSNSPSNVTIDKTLIDRFKVEDVLSIEEKCKDKVYPSFEDFKNWNEIYNFLKNELHLIKEKDHRIIEKLRYVEEQMNEYKKSFL